MAGKSDCIFYDFAGLVDAHGPLDFIRPKETSSSLVSCEECGKRNAAAAARCWNCDEPMTKLCPACVEPVEKGVMDCPHCGHKMRAGERSEAKAAKLLDTPSGAALISAYRPAPEREGGWSAVKRVWEVGGVHTVLTGSGETIELPAALVHLARDVRWIRAEDGAILVPNGANRTSVRMHLPRGDMLIVPMPPTSAS